MTSDLKNKLRQYTHVLKALRILTSMMLCGGGKEEICQDIVQLWKS